MRILYIHATIVPPPLDLQTDRFFLLSKDLEGDVLQPVWFKNPEEVEAVFGAGSYPAYTSGNFRYHWFLAFRHRGLRARLEQFWFYVRKGVQLHREQPFDCILAYSHMTTGLMGAAVKLFTRAKLIIEIVTTPDLIYVTNRPRPSFHDRVMKLYSDLCLHLSLWSADRAHLLYPGQLKQYPRVRNVRSSIFHEFIPISKIPAHEEGSERYVLLVGAPWYLKGADRLIAAFRQIAPEFPDVKLKILGWYPDRKELDALIAGCDQIEVLKARPNPETLQIMSRCAVLVQPSRCEGLPRVVMEGMGTGVPVIGSDVGGIPYLLRDDVNGYVVPGGDAEGIAERLRQLLLDGDLRKRLGAKGFERAHSELSEKAYVERFTEMVTVTIQGRE